MTPLAFRQAVYSSIYFLATLPIPVLIRVGDRLKNLEWPKSAKSADGEVPRFSNHDESPVASKAFHAHLRGDHVEAKGAQPASQSFRSRFRGDHEEAPVALAGC